MGELDGRRAEAGDLVLALGALPEVAFELGTLDVVERVDGVGAAEPVDVGVHGCIPKVSRRRMSPSLILVFAVPSGIPNRAATSVCVYPPK